MGECSQKSIPAGGTQSEGFVKALSVYHIAKKSQPDMVEGRVMKDTTHCKQELIVPDLKMDSKLDMS